MLSLHEALQLDFSCSGAPDMEVGFGFGFTPWVDTASPERAVLSSANLPDPDGEEAERRRMRRKISNRESAQRSRARRQQRLEDLRRDAARLRAEKRELEAQLRAVARRGLAVRRDNAWLRAEAAALRRRLYEAHRVAVLYGIPSEAPAGLALLMA